MEQTRADLISEIQALATTRGPYTWERWIHERVFWVSEMSCEQENDPPKAEHNNVISCQKQTQQYDSNGTNAHGIGSLKQLESEDSVRRYAWWTTQRSGLEEVNTVGGTSTRLCYADSSLSPMGRAWFSPSNSSVDCSVRILISHTNAHHTNLPTQLICLTTQLCLKTSLLHLL